ncbi:hypothetical protein DFH29DRAFT_983381 [Suillus ampliporus]|nr:hypothetical protein DFH29DRAFT_983381 [Suillus ampliporus]
MPNQWKPMPPLDIIQPHILCLWKACQTDKQIVVELLTKFLKIHEGMGLRRTCQQNHNVETIHDAMTNLCPMYPNAGGHKVVGLLFHEWNISVPRSIVISYFHTYEPELIHQCKANHLQRKRFWAAGVNDLFMVDQCDKWLRYGLGLHTGIEPFSGHIMWMRVWHSNWNPQLILSYYLDTVKMLGYKRFITYMPMLTQSDPGSENYGIANAHTMLCQWHNPALQGSLQHYWMRTKKNTLLDCGVTSSWYDTNNTLQLCIHFFELSILTLILTCDAYQDQVNNTRKWQDRNKILPHGAPDIIYQSPENFGVLDFKVSNTVRACSACSYHFVFSDQS